MKKTVIGMAMMAMALVGFNGMAQSTAQSAKAQVENNACCKQGDKNKKGDRKEAREKKNPYEGLNLTEAQKGKLAELDAKQQAKRQAAMEARKEGKDSKKQDFKNMSDAERQAAIQAMKDARKNEKLEYLQEVKEIIGPDQYVVFLENFYVSGGQQGGQKVMKQGQKGGKKSFAQGQNKNGKGSKKGGDRKGGQRGQKNGAAAAQQS